MTLRLTSQIDLNVYYDAERHSASDAILEVVTREVFAAFYAKSPSVGYECDGQPIGGVIFDGESAHIAVLPAYYGRWGYLLRPTLTWLSGLKEDIIFRTPVDNVKALKFLAHCGWENLGIEDDEVLHRLPPRVGNEVGFGRQRVGRTVV